MIKSNETDMMKIIASIGDRAYQKAFELAVRTGTALIVNRNGKIVEYRPPFKYVLVPIDEKPKVKKRRKNSNFFKGMEVQAFLKTATPPDSQNRPKVLNCNSSSGSALG